jgi:hypothetical protein
LTQIRSRHLEEAEEIDTDPRWQLVDRIVSSQCFAKSERLSSFLSCVCDLARRGQLEQINEQYIGTTVFGRRPGYDPAVDSIVRSHASRLRHRLDQYFAEEGTQEEWTLTIPKGSYLPVFHFRPGSDEPVAVDDGAGVSRAKESPIELHGLEALELREKDTPADSPHATAQGRYLVPALTGALIFVTLVALACAGLLIRQRRSPSVFATNVSESKRLFWSRLFSADQQTLVVNADSGLVMLQGFTKRPVTLPTYLNGTYLEAIPPSSTPVAQILNIGTRRYTSVVDLNIMAKILRMTGVDLNNTKFVYARDIRPREIKQGNLILLGTYESTPWVQLFEPGMNFYFQNDLAGGVFSVVNRQPRAGEHATYDSLTNDPDHTVYGVVAYRPSLNGSGKVLILEGQSMAGTETASDFVFDDGYLLPFLQSICGRDGAIPYFELLLRSKSMSGEASRIDIVASRIEDH